MVNTGQLGLGSSRPESSCPSGVNSAWFEGLLFGPILFILPGTLYTNQTELTRAELTRG